QPECTGQGAFQRGLLFSEVSGDARPRGTETRGKVQCPFELRGIPYLAPLGAIDVLQTPGLIPPRVLDVARPVRSEPHLLPRRRDREIGDPPRIGDLLAAGAGVDEPARGGLPADAPLGGVASTKVHGDSPPAVRGGVQGVARAPPGPPRATLGV